MGDLNQFSNHKDLTLSYGSKVIAVSYIRSEASVNIIYSKLLKTNL